MAARHVEVEPKETLMHASVAAGDAREAEKKKKIKTRAGRAEVGGEPIDIIVQAFANTYVIFATQLPNPGYIVRCTCDAVDGVVPSLVDLRTEPLLGNDTTVLNVVGKQLLQAMGGRREIIIHFGIRPRYTDPEDPDTCKRTIKELLDAIQQYRLW